MKKLELKHLALYLPYGLMINCDFKDGDVMALKLEGLTIQEAFLDGADWNYKDNTDFKPILRPLSDLTPKYLGELNLDISTEIQLDKVATKFILPTDVNYTIFIVLLKNHFDVFGLIEKGLAIDINTLK